MAPDLVTAAMHRNRASFLFVMAGLDPAIPGRLHVDPRVKPGDDGSGGNNGAAA